MSALGHKRTFRNVRAMSALPQNADIRCCDRHVRFVPKADILRRGRIGVIRSECPLFLAAFLTHVRHPNLSLSCRDAI
jgi:hypothetical protein